MNKKRKEALNMMYDKLYRFERRRAEYRKIKDKRRKKIISNYELTVQQRKEIDSLYVNNYGKRIKYDWHRLYSSYTGKFDVNYFPELLFIPDLQQLLVPRSYVKVFEDKNLLPIILGESDTYRMPKIYASCVNGIYRDSNMNFISIEKFIEIVGNIGNCFIKPTVDTGSGKDCMLLNIVDCVDTYSNKNIKDIINQVGKNFNIQEVIKNSKSISDLHPSSLNTFRIITYCWDGNVYHVPVALRVGRGGNNVDNAHKGGLFISVDDDGNLGKYAFSEFQEKYDKHPDTKIIFDGYRIPEVKKAIMTVENLQQRFPQIGIISWDATINDEGKVIIIETNLNSQTIWFPQMASGKSAFGEKTPEILRFIRDSK